MADNTTTYNAVIDVQVKGKDGVQELSDTVEKQDEKFVSLRRQIRETTVQLQAMADKGQQGTKEFKKLSDQLDELQDQQKRVAFQSAQIEDKLAALPGPIGNIGKGFASAKEAVDTFGKGLVIATGGVILIVEAFSKMYESLKSTSKGQETLNRFTAATSQLIAPLMALIQTVAIPVFEFLAKIVTKVAETFGYFAEKLGISKAEIKQFDEAAKKSAEEKDKQYQKDLDDAKKYADVVKQQKEETERKNKEAAEKAKQAAEKLLAKKLKDIETEGKYEEA